MLSQWRFALQGCRKLVLFCSYLHEQFSASICKSPGNQLSLWKKKFAEIVINVKEITVQENRTLFSLCGIYRMLSFSALNIDWLLETLGIEDSLHRTATCITSPLDYWVVYWRFHISDQLITLDIHLVSAFYKRQPQSDIASRLLTTRFLIRFRCRKCRWYTLGNNDKGLGKV